MKYRLIAFIFALPFLLISCDKEYNSNNAVIEGNWIEMTELTDYEALSFDGKDTLSFATRSHSRYVECEKYLYRLNDKHTKLYLWPADDPDHNKSTHKILIHSETNELTIWGLHASAPDRSQVFKKSL